MSAARCACGHQRDQHDRVGLCDACFKAGDREVACCASDEPANGWTRLCPGSGREALDIRYLEGTCPVCLTRQPLAALSAVVTRHDPNTPTA